ncbi:uncharacterized protein LOC144767225 [Lissotriton helveticus]
MTGLGAHPGVAAPRGRRQVLASLLFLWVCEAVGAQVQYSISEELKRGSVVGNIAKDLGLNIRSLSGRNLRVVSDADKQYLTVNPVSGDLQVSDRIGRDEMCGESPTCSLTFEAVVENPMNVFHVEVFIKDINDNPPSFPKNSVDVEIVETFLSGTRIALGNARDPDIGINALQGYKLSPNPHFVLQEKTSSDGYRYTELVLETVLDREKESHHRLVLTATDGGDPIRSSTVDININVLDANDDFPVFSQEVYRASISEGAAINSLVLQVKATDKDEGPNAKITYTFWNTAEQFFNTFALDADTGKIQIKSALDFEKINSYKMVVEARDGGGHVAQCRVHIEVTDENDNAPEVICTSVSSSLPEDSSPGTVVALISVHDRDAGDNGKVLCQIQDNIPFRLISSSGKYYKLVTESKLDRESVPEYNITVTATDKGSPPLAISRTIRLQLSDINDNPPIFGKSSYQVYVPENNAAGVSIYCLKASDVDLDLNARVTYFVQGTHQDIPLSSYIFINSQTGLIYAQRSYDYEQLKEFQFQVRGQDSGSPALSSNVTVRVFIVDQNDNSHEVLSPAPSPDGSVMFEMVPHYSERDHLITKVVVVDADSGHNAWLSYHLPQTSDPSLFTIGLHTGEIRTSRVFQERDALKQKVVILVKDNGQPPLSATVTLNVVFAENIQEALPELSNQPRDTDHQSNLNIYLVLALAFISLLFVLSLMLVVIFKCRNHKEPRMAKTARPCYSGGQASRRCHSGAQSSRRCDSWAQASRRCDSGDQTSWRCDSGAQASRRCDSVARSSRRCYSGAQAPRRCYSGDQSSRRCDSWAQASRRCDSGDQTSWRCDSGAQASRRCDSVARSSRRCYSGAPLLLLGALLTVCEAASGQPRYSIPEEMRKGAFVGNVALDLGLDANELSEGGARVNYRGRTQYFVLSLNKGQLYVSESIDREGICGNTVQCLLNIEIISKNIMKVYEVEVEIQDINDNSPTFTDDQITLQVLENTNPGTRFVLPEAHDADVGVYSLQNYQLSENKHFKLDIKSSTDGTKYAELVLEKPLDREEQEVHSLILTATDGGDPVRSGTMRIQINVQDVNDNAPVFSQSVYKISVPENISKGTVVGSVTAVDIDMGTNSEVTYSFSKMNDNIVRKFRLDYKTGEISLIENLDFERNEFYEFEVRGSDGILSSRCKVMIEVINVNDNSPEILMSSVLTQVPENSPLGTVIALLQVYDRDLGEHGKVTCFLPPHLPFQLLKSIGNYYSLAMDSVLDREQVPQYNITITATDSGTPPLSTTKSLNLQIEDENDNPPVFNQMSYSACIMENIPQGTSIFAAKAADMDYDKNAKISYSIIDGRIGDFPLSSYISINSESGVIYALQPFDFEVFRQFQIQVQAQDGGSPSLMSNVTVTFFILDQNDNTPEILYPSSPTDGSSGVEMAPRSSEPGYLITKVIAVDSDSGKNAWLSYQLVKSTDQGLFTVGLHTGEIRTARPIMEKDAIKQFLVVIVKDNGQAPLLSSVTVTIVLADSMPEMLHDISNPSAPADMESNLTLYLVIAVAVISFLFLFLIILLLAIRIHRWRESQLCQSSGVNFNALPGSQFVGIDGVRAFLQTYSHDGFSTAETGKKQFIFPNSSGSSNLSANPNLEKTDPPLFADDFLCMDKEDQPFIQWFVELSASSAREEARGGAVAQS